MTIINTRKDNQTDAYLNGINTKLVKVIQYDTNGNIISGEDKDYATQYAVDSVSESISYYGNALVGSETSASVWQIKKIECNALNLSITWAGDKFNNIWDDRESLTYT